MTALVIELPHISPDLGSGVAHVHACARRSLLCRQLFLDPIEAFGQVRKRPLEFGERLALLFVSIEHRPEHSVNPGLNSFRKFVIERLEPAVQIIDYPFRFKAEFQPRDNLTVHGSSSIDRADAELPSEVARKAQRDPNLFIVLFSHTLTRLSTSPVAPF